MSKEDLIKDISKKTGRSIEQVQIDLRAMADESKRGTKNKAEGLTKFKESVNAYMFIHKLPV
jgi:hypothetical protein